MSDDPKAPGSLGRRRLLDGALAVGACGAAGAVAVPAVRFATPPSEGGAGTSVTVRREEVLSEGAKLVFVGAEPVLVVALSGGELRALGARCTHLGCTVGLDRASGELRCGCHGGRFGLDGRVLSGPPPAPLAQYAVTARDGLLVVEGRRPWRG
ncbi:MAG: Rieske (2Fe-2S) protein [Deltaproteobacteria bacterium]|nr:Rieske (2Fe-2S) protein [Deltaproteobacteria bacterium]